MNFHKRKSRNSNLSADVAIRSCTQPCYNFQTIILWVTNSALQKRQLFQITFLWVFFGILLILGKWLKALFNHI